MADDKKRTPWGLIGTAIAGTAFGLFSGGIGGILLGVLGGLFAGFAVQAGLDAYNESTPKTGATGAKPPEPGTNDGKSKDGTGPDTPGKSTLLDDLNKALRSGNEIKPVMPVDADNPASGIKGGDSAPTTLAVGAGLAALTRLIVQPTFNAAANRTGFNWALEKLTGRRLEMHYIVPWMRQTPEQKVLGAKKALGEYLTRQGDPNQSPPQRALTEYEAATFRKAIHSKQLRALLPEADVVEMQRLVKAYDADHPGWLKRMFASETAAVKSNMGEQGEVWRVRADGRTETLKPNEEAAGVRVQLAGNEKMSPVTYILDPKTDIAEFVRNVAGTPEEITAVREATKKALLEEAKIQIEKNAKAAAQKGTPVSEAQKATALETVSKSIDAALEPPKTGTAPPKLALENIEGMSKLAVENAVSKTPLPTSPIPAAVDHGHFEVKNRPNVAPTIELRAPGTKAFIVVELVPESEGMGKNTYRTRNPEKGTAASYYTVEQVGDLVKVNQVTDISNTPRAQATEAARGITGIDANAVKTAANNVADYGEWATGKKTGGTPPTTEQTAAWKAMTPEERVAVVKAQAEAIVDSGKTGGKPVTESSVSNIVNEVVAKRTASPTTSSTTTNSRGVTVTDPKVVTTTSGGVDGLAKIGATGGNEPTVGGEETGKKPPAPGSAIDELANLGGDKTTGTAEALKRGTVLATIDHFDRIDVAAARKSSKMNAGEVVMPDQIKGTAAEAQMSKYQKLAAEVQQTREALAGKKAWTETGDARTAKAEQMKAEIVKKQAEMKQVREEFRAANKEGVNHIEGLRASRRLDGLSMVQGSLMLADTYMNTNENTPGRTGRLVLGYGQLSQSTVAYGLNTAALWKPESEVLKRSASGFGVGGNTFGVGLNSYMLVEHWNSGTVTTAFSGDNSKMKTWDARAQVGSSTGMLVGDLASLGSRGAAWYTGGAATAGTAGTLANVAWGANVVGLVLLDAKLIYDDVRKWQEFNEVTREIAVGLTENARLQAGNASVRDVYVDIPGVPPQTFEYSKLHQALGRLRGKNNYDIGYIDRKILDDKDPRKMMLFFEGCLKNDQQFGKWAESRMEDQAKAVSWVCDSLMGNIISSKADQDMVQKTFQDMGEGISTGKVAEVGLVEFNGTLPAGARNYVSRFDDYEKLIKPIEKTHKYQVEQLFHIVGITRTLNPRTQSLGLHNLGIKENSPELDSFRKAFMSGEALDQQRMETVRPIIETKDLEKIRIVLGLDEKDWTYRHGLNKSLKEHVEEMIKTNNMQALHSLAHNHVQETGEAKRAAFGWLSKQNFQQEMKKVEALIEEDRKNKPPKGQGKADEFFRTNASFRKVGGDRWKGVNFVSVGLSASYEEYMAKKMEFAPLTLLEEVKKTTDKFNTDVIKAKKDNEELGKAVGADLEGQVKELGGTLEDAEILGEDGETVYRDDGKGRKVPMMVPDRIKIYDNSIRLEEDAIKLIQVRLADPKNLTYETADEVNAKVAFHKQAIAQLQLEREVVVQSNSIFKLKQADEIKNKFRQETLRLFKEIKDIDPKVLEVAEKDDKDKIEKLTGEVKEKSEKLKAVTKDTSIADALKAETAFLKAHRDLAKLLKATAEKTRDKREKEKRDRKTRIESFGSLNIAEITQREAADNEVAIKNGGLYVPVALEVKSHGVSSRKMDWIDFSKQIPLQNIVDYFTPEARFARSLNMLASVDDEDDVRLEREKRKADFIDTLETTRTKRGQAYYEKQVDELAGKIPEKLQAMLDAIKTKQPEEKIKETLKAVLADEKSREALTDMINSKPFDRVASMKTGIHVQREKKLELSEADPKLLAEKTGNKWLVEYRPLKLGADGKVKMYDKTFFTNMLGYLDNEAGGKKDAKSGFMLYADFEYAKAPPPPPSLMPTGIAGGSGTKQTGTAGVTGTGQGNGSGPGNTSGASADDPQVLAARKAVEAERLAAIERAKQQPMQPGEQMNFTPPPTSTFWEHNTTPGGNGLGALPVAGPLPGGTLKVAGRGTLGGPGMAGAPAQLQLINIEVTNPQSNLNGQQITFIGENKGGLLYIQEMNGMNFGRGRVVIDMRGNAANIEAQLNAAIANPLQPTLYTQDPATQPLPPQFQGAMPGPRREQPGAPNQKPVPVQGDELSSNTTVPNMLIDMLGGLLPDRNIPSVVANDPKTKNKGPDNLA